MAAVSARSPPCCRCPTPRQRRRSRCHPSSCGARPSRPGSPCFAGKPRVKNHAATDRGHSPDRPDFTGTPGMAGADIARLPVLLLLTTRVAPQASWLQPPGAALLRLERLSDAEAAALVAAQAGGLALSAGQIDDVVARTDVIPLFIEEFLRAMAATSRADGPGAAGHAPMVPETLHDSLMARLDRLGPGKDVAQAASVIGRRFTVELLEEVLSLERRQIEDTLDFLCNASVLHPTSPDDRSEFVFSPRAATRRRVPRPAAQPATRTPRSRRARVEPSIPSARAGATRNVGPPLRSRRPAVRGSASPRERRPAELEPIGQPGVPGAGDAGPGTDRSGRRTAGTRRARGEALHAAGSGLAGRAQFRIGGGRGLLHSGAGAGRAHRRSGPADRRPPRPLFGPLRARRTGGSPVSG